MERKQNSNARRTWKQRRQVQPAAGTLSRVKPSNVLILSCAMCLTASIAGSPRAKATAPEPEISSVYALPPEEFLAGARRDATALVRYDAGLRRIQAQLAEHPDLFQIAKNVSYSPEQKRLILSAWGAAFDYVLSSEMLRQRYWDFVKERPTSDAHAIGFTLTHGALTAELARGLAVADLCEGHPQLETLLDEPNAEFGIPPHAYSDFKYKVIHVSTAAQLVTGDAYGESILPHLGKVAVLSEPDFKTLAANSRENSKVAKDWLTRHGVALFAGNAADIFKSKTAQGLLPYQTGIAEWLSHTRVRRKGKPLIQRDQAKALLGKMEPGDILVARQNWFLSNIGLPGFWPHAELYLGSPPEFAAYFDSDPKTSGYVKALPHGQATLSQYLTDRFPEKWRAFNGLDFKGEPVRVMEAISEGVSFTGIGHAMLTDYLGVMRPRLTRLEKAKAMIRAFEYQGRPYDFEFDFYSDAALVCSELVYKSYAPSDGMRGIKIPLVSIAGRMTLPPTEFVKLLDAEYDKPDRQLDFVAFLDGREALNAAVPGDAESFRKSYQRPKWDVFQK
jgi:hypothetical protein